MFCLGAILRCLNAGVLSAPFGVLRTPIGVLQDGQMISLRPMQKKEDRHYYIFQVNIACRAGDHS